jgi:hypothetical protein
MRALGGLVRHFAVLAFLLGCAGLAYGAPKEKQAITVTFERTSVTATGLTPGAQVVLFGVGREPKTYYSVVRPHADMQRDTDGDGVIRFAVPRVNRQSQWAVIDMTSGFIKLAAPPGFGVESHELDEKHFKKATNGKLKKLEIEAQHAIVLWVRPDVGAWLGALHDAGSDDDDHKANSRVTLDTSTLKKVGNTTEAEPGELGLRDVVIVVDTDEMTILVLEGRK